MAEWRVTCPSCETGLKITNPALAGKTLKCPKCATPFALPAELPDTDEDDPTPPPKPRRPARAAADADDDRPARKPRRVADDEDDRPRKPRARRRDDDADDDRPRKKKRKKAASAGGAGMARTLIGAGVLVVVVAVAVVVWMNRSKDKGDTASAGPGGDAASGEGDGGRRGPGPQAKADDKVKVIAPRTQFKVVFPVSGPIDSPEINKLSLSADGSRVAVSNRSLERKSTEVWSVAGGAKKVGGFAGSHAFLSPDGKWFGRWGNSFNFEYADAETGATTVKDAHNAGMHMYFRTPDVLLYLPRSQDWREARPFKITEIDAKTGKALDSYEAGDDDRVELAPPVKNGRELVFGHPHSTTIKVWDLVDRKELRSVTLASPKKPKYGTGPMSWSGFTVSPDGRLVALKPGGYPTDIYDSTTGAAVATLPDRVYPINPAFLPGRDVYLVPSNITRANTDGNSGDVVAYDVKRKEFVAAFRGHPGHITQLAVSANGKVLATGHNDGAVLIWDLTQVP